MYFAKYRIDKSNPRIRRALADRQEMHAAVQRMFGTDRKTSNVLYRINGDALYLSAKAEPNNNDMFELMKARELGSTNGTHRFSIVVIPRKTENGKKTIIKTEIGRLAWLNRKAEENGFRIMSVTERGRESIVSRRKGFDIDAFRYDGILNITDVKKFERAMLIGIGSMKAYGCGMLIVA